MQGGVSPHMSIPVMGIALTQLVCRGRHTLWKQFAKQSFLSFHCEIGFFEATRGLWWQLKWLFESILKSQQKKTGTSLVVQWLEFHTSTAGGAGPIPGQETKILKAARRGQE